MPHGYRWKIFLLSVVLCVMLGSLRRMMRRVRMMAASDVGMMSRSFVLSCPVMLRSMFVMLSGVPMMFGSLIVMSGDLFFHLNCLRLFQLIGAQNCVPQS